MGIALYAKNSAGRAVVLGVERIAVIGFDAAMRVEEVAIASKYAAAVGGLVLDAVVGRALHDATEHLYGDFVVSGFSDCENRRQRYDGEASNDVTKNFFPNIVLLLCFNGLL